SGAEALIIRKKAIADGNPNKNQGALLDRAPLQIIRLHTVRVHVPRLNYNSGGVIEGGKVQQPLEREDLSATFHLSFLPLLSLAQFSWSFVRKRVRAERKGSLLVIHDESTLCNICVTLIKIVGLSTMLTRGV